VSVSRFDITPIRIYGTASVGVYMAANDEYALIPADSPEKVDRHVEDTLKVKVIKLTVGRSPLLTDHCILQPRRYLQLKS